MDAVVLFIVAIAWIAIDQWKENRKNKMIKHYKEKGDVKKMTEWIIK